MVALRHDGVYDITRAFATMRDLCETRSPAAAVAGGRKASASALSRTFSPTRRRPRAIPAKPWFLAPNDLQAIKAAGVTFAISLLERVIEEQARGAPERAAEARREVEAALGGKVAGLKPGSPEAMELKKLLQAKGLWSQYLEVGIGPDAEIFTKAPPMAAVGTGASIGILPISQLEQSGARDRARGHLARRDRRRHARQRRQPARHRRPLGAAARQMQGQQRVRRDRPVHPSVRRHLLARRCAPRRR